MVRLEPKASTEVRNYKFDWTTFLGPDDTIATSTITGTGLTINGQSNDTTSASVTVSGGTSGTVGILHNTITTAGGLTETETYTLKIDDTEEPLSVDEMKQYLGLYDNDRDAEIASMIPRARLWVEDYTGLALTRRQFVEWHTPQRGVVQLFKGPLVSVEGVSYGDSAGLDQTYVPRSFPPSSRLVSATASSWPVIQWGEQFAVTYTAGFAVGEVDDRLIGAMKALIEGEFSEGYAYPSRSLQSAEICCGQLRVQVA